MAQIKPVRLAYDIHEPVNGADPSLAPLLFLHGVTAFKEHWEDIPQSAANASKRKAYSIDARNHGDSEWSDYFNFDVNVVDLIHFMDSVGISKAILVGHSMGGMTAIKTALKQPDRVEKIVVEDMNMRKASKEVTNTVLTYVTLARIALETAPPNLDDDGLFWYLITYFATNLPPDLVELLKQGEQEPESMKRLLKFSRDADGRYHWKANLEVIERALQNPETLSSDPEGSSDGEACFIYGKLSPFLVGDDEQHIKQFFPNAVFVGIEDAAHNVHTDKPLEFTDALIKFIS